MCEYTLPRLRPPFRSLLPYLMWPPTCLRLFEARQMLLLNMPLLTIPFIALHSSDCLLSGTRFTCVCPSLQSRSIGNEHGMNQHVPTAGGPRILVVVGAPTSLLLSSCCGGLLVSHSPSFSSSNPCVECGHSELVLQKYRKVIG